MRATTGQRPLSEHDREALSAIIESVYETEKAVANARYHLARLVAGLETDDEALHACGLAP